MSIKKRMKQNITGKEQITALLFCALWIIGFLALTLYPLIMSFVFSFNDVRVTSQGVETDPVGGENYRRVLFEDDVFTEAIGDYIVEILISVPVIIVISLVLALLLNVGLKGTSIFRTIFFLPVIIASGPVMSKFIENGVASFPGIEKMIDFAALSETLPAFMVDALSYLVNEFIMILWFCGIQILVFMTGLMKLDRNMYEAASIDGAGPWERFWKITLPALNPMIVINVIFTVVMQSVFALNPIIAKIQDDMYAVSFGFGYASAAAWIYLLVLVLLLGFWVLVFRKRPDKADKRA